MICSGGIYITDDSATSGDASNPESEVRFVNHRGLFTHYGDTVTVYNGSVSIPTGLVSKAVHHSDTWRTQLTLTLTPLCDDGK